MPPTLDLDNLFSYHPPKGDQQERYIRIRAAAKHLAEEIVACSKPSAEQTLAIRDVQRASMMANAAIACNE